VRYIQYVTAESLMAKLPKEEQLDLLVGQGVNARTTSPRKGAKYVDMAPHLDLADNDNGLQETGLNAYAPAPPQLAVHIPHLSCLGEVRSVSDTAAYSELTERARGRSLDYSMTVEEFMQNEWDFTDDLPHTDEFGVTRRNVRPLPSLRCHPTARLRAGSPTPVALTVGIGPTHVLHCTPPSKLQL
jgi:hypothetical protein